MPVQARQLTRIALAVGVVATGFVAVSPFIRLAYRQPELHVAIETATGLAALLIAYLFFGRFRAQEMSTDLLLAGVFALAALVNLFLLAVPAGIESGDRVFSAWAPAVGRSLVAAGLFAAAVMPTRSMRVGRAPGWRLAAVCVGVTAVVAGAVALAEPSLPVGVDPDIEPADRIPDLEGHSAILFVQLASMVLLAGAAVGFLRQAEQRRDDLMAWVAAAAILSAFGRLNYFLFPSLYSEWISTGDLLRLLAHVVLVVGAAREIRDYWMGQAEAAAAEERRRIARELHDGMAQELALVTAHATLLSRPDPPPGTSERLATSAERALDEARMAIHALSRAGETLDVALEGVLGDVAQRLDVHLDVDLPEDVEAPSEVATAILRIAREALVNAARHGSARRVEVSLAVTDGYSLTVSDDGSGYVPSEGRRPGFGLTSMQERTEALRGRFDIRPGERGGTEVEVWIPRA